MVGSLKLVVHKDCLQYFKTKVSKDGSGRVMIQCSLANFTAMCNKVAIPYEKVRRGFTSLPLTIINSLTNNEHSFKYSIYDDNTKQDVWLSTTDPNLYLLINLDPS